MRSGLSVADAASRSQPTARDENEDASLAELESRIGRAHLTERLAHELAHERAAQTFLRRFFYGDAWYSAQTVIRASLRAVGLHERARRNARRLIVRENDVPLASLPGAFHGFTILHISDPHVDLGPDISDALIESVGALAYDLCVLTGDYRTQTFGSCEPTLAAMAHVRAHLKSPVYAVLGNHDSIRMVPGFERLGIRVLINESVALAREAQTLHLAGIDDAHKYRLHDLALARRRIPADAVSILLSHTPEPYRDAAAAGFHLMLSGHTHGGQICLPGGFPLIIDAACPRRYAKGAWRHENMIGYTSSGSGTSIADVRLNCPAEVTLHRLLPA